MLKKLCITLISFYCVCVVLINIAYADELKTSQETLFIQQKVNFIVELHTFNNIALSSDHIQSIEQSFAEDLYRYKLAVKRSGRSLELVSVNISKKVISYTFFNHLQRFYITQKDEDLVDYYADDLCDFYVKKHQKSCSDQRDFIFYELIAKIIREKVRLNTAKYMSLDKINHSHDFEPDLEIVLLKLSKGYEIL